MKDKVNELLNKFYNEDGDLQRYFYDEEAEEEMELDDELNNLFDSMGFQVDEYSIDIGLCAEGPSFEDGYVSIAFIENGKLCHITDTYHHR